MERKKHALVIFTKFPQPGVTKTRLMEENGGQLTPQEAADLYKAMVLDTAMVGTCALDDCSRLDDLDGDFHLYVSSSPESTLAKVKKMFDAELPGKKLHYMVDRGQNFDEHFNDCYNQLFDNGYHSVVCIGGDMPAMTPDLVVRAFQWMSQLEKGEGDGAMALAPCQAGGVSLVGVTKSANMDFRGVFYNTGGVAALDAIINIGQRKGIPTALFEALSDVDFMEDLAHMITVINAMEYCAKFQPGVVVPRRTLDFVRQVGLVSTTPPNNNCDPRSQIDGSH